LIRFDEDQRIYILMFRPIVYMWPCYGYGMDYHCAIEPASKTPYNDIHSVTIICLIYVFVIWLCKRGSWKFMKLVLALPAYFQDPKFSILNVMPNKQQLL